MVSKLFFVAPAHDLQILKLCGPLSLSRSVPVPAAGTYSLAVVCHGHKLLVTVGTQPEYTASVTSVSTPTKPDSTEPESENSRPYNTRLEWATGGLSLRPLRWHWQEVTESDLLSASMPRIHPAPVASGLAMPCHRDHGCRAGRPAVAPSATRVVPGTRARLSPPAGDSVAAAAAAAPVSVHRPPGPARRWQARRWQLSPREIGRAHV